MDISHQMNVYFGRMQLCWDVVSSSIVVSDGNGICLCSVSKFLKDGSLLGLEVLGSTPQLLYRSRCMYLDDFLGWTPCGWQHCWKWLVIWHCWVDSCKYICFWTLYTRCFFMQWRCRCSGSEIGDEVVVPELFGYVVGIHVVVTIFWQGPSCPTNTWEM